MGVRRGWVRGGAAGAAAVIASMVCAGVQAQTAGDGSATYTLDGCRLEATAPVEIGRATGHFWFPSLHRLGAQDVLCVVCVTDDKPQGRWPAALCLSRDGGTSWRSSRDPGYYGTSSTPLGDRGTLFLPYETQPAGPTDKRNAHADGTVVTLDKTGALTLASAPVTFSGFPRDLADYHTGEVYLLTNGNILALEDGRLFTTAYGKCAGDTLDSIWALTSADGGVTWTYGATVASGAAIQGATEGANESNTVRLADGRLLCIFRTGGDYHKSYSADGGATWSPPERMTGTRGVEPQLLRLGNGVLVLSGGRPGLYVWVCTDERGEAWQRFALAEHHNRLTRDKALRYAEGFCNGEATDPPQSTSYTGLIAAGPDSVLVCYDRLANGWQGAPGPWGTEDAVFCVRLTIAAERRP